MTRTETKKIAPSSIARRIASEMWPEVQVQQRITKGVYDFHCAGHGGIVAILDATSTEMLPETARAAAAANGLTMEYVIFTSGRRTRLATSQGVDPETWATWRDSPVTRAFTVAAGTAWIGEEDCDWSTIISASRAMTDAWVESRRGRVVGDFTAWEAEMRPYPRDCATRWRPDYVAALDTATANF